MAVKEFWSRALNLGRAVSPLEADLQRITELELIDVPPKDALLHVTQASHDAEDRRVILRHLQECLAETGGKRWRRIHGGMVLLDQLLQQGAPALVSEIAEGLHFDPVQRLTFLERFDYVDDRRVQQMVRQKASALRADLVPRLQAASDGAAPVAASSSSPPGRNGSRHATPAGGGGGGSAAFVGFGSDTLGGSGGGMAPDGASQSKYVGFGSDDTGSAAFIANGQVGKKKFVNGLVAVGHRDDTSSGSSGGEGAGKGDKDSKAHRAGGAGTLPGRRRTALEESTESESDAEREKRRRERRSRKAAAAARGAAPAPPPAPPPAAQSDLLGGMDTPSVKEAPSPSAAAQDLLGGLVDCGDVQAAPAKAPPQGNNLLDF